MRRAWRLLSICVAGSASSAGCAFWGFDDWSDRRGMAGDASADAQAGEAGPDAGVTGCAAYPGVLACDDFEGPDAGAGQRDVAEGCTLDVRVPPGGAVSPTRALHAESHAVGRTEGGQASVMRTFGAPSPLPAALEHRFWLYIDRADPVSTATVQEVGFQGGGSRLLVRVILSDREARFSTLVDASGFPNAVYGTVGTAAVGAGAWHSFVITLSRASSPARVTAVLDGTTVVDDVAVAQSDRALSSLDAAVMRTGIRYLGVPPDAQGWRLYLDDVVLTSTAR